MSSYRFYSREPCSKQSRSASLKNLKTRSAAERIRQTERLKSVMSRHRHRIDTGQVPIDFDGLED